MKLLMRPTHRKIQCVDLPLSPTFINYISILLHHATSVNTFRKCKKPPISGGFAKVIHTQHRWLCYFLVLILRILFLFDIVMELHQGNFVAMIFF